MSSAESEVGIEQLGAVLAARLEPADTELTLQAPDTRVAQLPDSAFQIKIGNEIIGVGTRTAYSCTDLTRGEENTNAATHAAGDSIALIIGGEKISQGGGTIIASDINSQDASDGYVITADGEGGSNYQAPGGGSQPALTPTAVQIADYDAAPGQLVLVNDSEVATPGLTITLPEAPADQTVIGVLKVASSGGAPTGTLITASGSDVIGAAGNTIAFLGTFLACIVFQYDTDTATWCPTSGGDSNKAFASIGFYDPLEINPAAYTQFPAESVGSGAGLGIVQMAVTTIPQLVAPMGIVVNGPNGQIGNLPPNEGDTYDITAVLTVSNLAGTEVIQVKATASIAAGGLGGAPDFSTAEATAVAGTDLVWDSEAFGTVTSTAGGIFAAILTLAGGWD